MQHEIEIKDTVGAHVRRHKSAEPKVGDPALLTVKGELVPMTVRCITEIKRTSKDDPREVAVWMFVIRKSGDGKTLVKHRGSKGQLEIGTVAAAKAVAKRLEELKPKPKAKKVSAPLVEVPAAHVTAEQKKAKKAKTKAKHEAVAAK